MGTENSETEIPATVIETYKAFLLELEKLGLTIDMVSIVISGMHLPHKEENGVPVPHVYHARNIISINSSLTVYPVKETKQKKTENQ